MYFWFKLFLSNVSDFFTVLTLDLIVDRPTMLNF